MKYTLAFICVFVIANQLATIDGNGGTDKKEGAPVDPKAKDPAAAAGATKTEGTVTPGATTTTRGKGADVDYHEEYDIKKHPHDADPTEVTLTATTDPANVVAGDHGATGNGEHSPVTIKIPVQIT